MKGKTIKTMIVAIATVLLALNSVDACTGIMLKTKDGSIVHGRTLEFGTKVETDIVVIPRNYQFVGQTANGDGLKYKSKYAVMGGITFGVNVLADGMNEKGLSCGIFFFPTYASYSELTKENQNKALSPLDFTNWILTQFATVEDVKKAIENNEVNIVATVLKGWGATAPPFHYAVYDKSGKSIVIEPIDGELKVYDNPTGVLTNSPSFDWHMTNLRNYISLSPNNAEDLEISNTNFQQFGQGTGMFGIPGDFTPPSRFVRATAFCATSITGTTATEGVNQVFHILNNFDIPKGFSREVVDGTIYSDYTQLTVARDPQNLKYYYRTHNDQTIKVISLNSFDLDGKNIKVLSTESGQSYVDVSKKLISKK